MRFPLIVSIFNEYCDTATSPEQVLSLSRSHVERSPSQLAPRLPRTVAVRPGLLLPRLLPSPTRETASTEHHRGRGAACAELFEQSVQQTKRSGDTTTYFFSRLLRNTLLASLCTRDDWREVVPLSFLDGVTHRLLQQHAALCFLDCSSVVADHGQRCFVCAENISRKPSPSRAPATSADSAATSRVRRRRTC